MCTKPRNIKQKLFCALFTRASVPASQRRLQYLYLFYVINPPLSPVYQTKVTHTQCHFIFYFWRNKSVFLLLEYSFRICLFEKEEKKMVVSRCRSSPLPLFFFKCHRVVSWCVSFFLSFLMKLKNLFVFVFLCFLKTKDKKTPEDTLRVLTIPFMILFLSLSLFFSFLFGFRQGDQMLCFSEHQFYIKIYESGNSLGHRNTK